MSTTDGVGTKSEVARLVGRYDTIGIDCVAMSVDDLAVCGAEPLFFLDYISVGRNDPAMIEALVSGVADGLPAGRVRPRRRGDLRALRASWSRATSTSSASPSAWWRPTAGCPAGVRAGDRVVGIASPGLRSNGYSLARKVLRRAGRPTGSTSRPGPAPTSPWARSCCGRA